MKILQVINSLATGGAEKLLLDTIPMYNELGIHMDLLVFWQNNHQFLNALKEYKNINVLILNNSENIKDVYKFNNIFKIKKYLKHYDIIHVHLFPALYYTPFAKMISNSSTKLLFTEHSTTNRRMEKPIFKSLDRFVYKKYAKVICITQEIKEKFQKYYNLPAAKFELIENGVNIDVVKNSPAIDKDLIVANYQQNDIIITQVSAFRPGKDQDTLIKAMALLPDNYKLVLVGDGIRRIVCEELVRSLNLTNKVFFLGQRMDVPKIIKASNINVLSTEWEGLSLASIEAMASGKPFIASEVPGLSDLVKGYGVLFPLGNETILANEILKLSNDSNYYNNVVEKCQLRAQAFDIKKMVDKHIAIYNEVYNTK